MKNNWQDYTLEGNTSLSWTPFIFLNYIVRIQDNLSDDSSIPSVVRKNSKTSPINLSKDLKQRLPTATGDNRLFSTGLHGLLIEHDLDKLDHINDDNLHNQDKQTVWSVTSGAAWCMSYNTRAKKLAVGTEEGILILIFGEYKVSCSVRIISLGRPLCLNLKLFP